jgi:exonuclease III
VRIGTWNCAGALTKKWDVLERVAADVTVVQECASTTVAEAADRGWQACWRGTDPKGLAVVARPGFQLLALSSVGDWSLPVQVRGARTFTIIGFWALPRTLTGCSYTQQAHLTLRDVDRSHGDVAMAGDFNAYDHPDHRTFLEAMAERGLVSAFHVDREELRDEESEATYFHGWTAPGRSHIDLVFVPAKWSLQAVTVGTFADVVAPRISDHVPVVATID